MDDPNVPPPEDQAIYLLTDLADLLERSDIGEWPEGHQQVFRKRLAQVIARVGPGQ